jgi:putative addiction module component (TIGR02574 family)
MDFKELENRVLHLSRDERAELMQKLVLSLDAPAPADFREEWLAEAGRRIQELDDGSVETVPGDEVLRKARSLTR